LLKWLPSRTQTTTTIGEDVSKKELSYIDGGNVNWYNHVKQYEASSKTKNRNVSEVGHLHAHAYCKTIHNS
jgi:hypothetical protein